MPKPLSDSEREYIREKLLTEAETCLAQYGIKKTTVDELVRRANIPKGTFYLFYESKELLVFEVFNRIHDRIHQQLILRMGQISAMFDAEEITELIYGLYIELEGSFLYRFLIDGELELLLRKLPPEVAKQHTQKDDLSVEQFFGLIPGIMTDRVQVFSAALRAVFVSMLYRREIGEDHFHEALKIMIRGVVRQLFEESVQ